MTEHLPENQPPAPPDPAPNDELAAARARIAELEAQAADQPAPAEPPAAPAEPSVPEIAPGVPLYRTDLPEGFGTIAWLASYDPDATHEVGQPKNYPETDVEGSGGPLKRSGGAAYYVDLSTGKGFSVALNPEGA